MLDNVQHDLDMNAVSQSTFDKLQTVLTQEPSNALAHVLLGKSYDAVGMREMAKEQFAKAHVLDPARSKEILRQFKEKYRTDNPASAFMDWVEIRQTFPKDDDIREMETVVALLFETVSTAESAYISERKHGHPLMSVATMISKRRSVQKRFAEALQLALTDLKLHPNDAEALIAKAAALNGLGQYKEAILAVRPVYLRWPYQPGIAYHLAAANHHDGRDQAALEPALFNLARSSSDRDQQEAIALLQLILPGVSNEVLASNLERVGKRIDQTAYHSEYHHSLGLLFEKQGDFNAAERELRTAVDGNKPRSQWMLELGRVNESKGRYREALECYLAAETMSQGSVETVARLNRYEMRLVNRPNDLAWRLKDVMRGR